MNKNITFFDFETTGIDTKSASVVSIYASNEKKRITIDTLINPECPIPIESTKIHQITDKDVVHKPKFIDLKKSVEVIFNDTNYICGYNIAKYDLPLLVKYCIKDNINLELSDVKIIDLYYIAKVLYNKSERKGMGGLTLSNFYKEVIGKDFLAHNAHNDVEACIKLFSKISKMKSFNWGKYLLYYEDIKGSIITDKGYILKFGKYEGYSIADLINVDKGYLKYLNNNKIIWMSMGISRQIYT